MVKYGSAGCLSLRNHVMVLQLGGLRPGRLSTARDFNHISSTLSHSRGPQREEMVYEILNSLNIQRFAES